MAGIIAQLNAANRRRKNRKFREISNEKSVYEISPFPSGPFSPPRHNKWLVQVNFERFALFVNIITFPLLND